MKRFIYRNAFLCELLAIIPVAFLTAYLTYTHQVSGAIYILLVVWSLAVIGYVNHRIPTLLHRVAMQKLDEQCEPEGFLADIRFLLSRRSISARQRFFLQMENACGLDALGHSAEALAEVERLLPQIPLLAPTERLLFRINYTTVALHVERARPEVPRLLRELEDELTVAGFPPPLADSFRAQIETLRDSYRFENGEYYGLRERYVAAAESARVGGAPRRMVMHCCYRLARLYDKLDRRREAAALYAYVEQNGNRLGIVAFSREARAALLAREETAQTAPVCCENEETPEETVPNFTAETAEEPKGE